MPTVLGLIFFCFGAYYFLAKQDRLFGLLIVASIFQASSAVKIGERGIPSFYLVELLIIARAVANQLLRGGSHKPMPQRRWLLAFGAIGVASAFVGPALFAGIPVYDPLLGIDAGLFLRPPLHFNKTNVTQATYLLLHVATAHALLQLNFSARHTRRACIFAFYFVTLAVAGQAFCRVAGIPFPDTLIRNNPGVWGLVASPGAVRKPGTFLEPSFAGAFFVFYGGAFTAEYLAGKGRGHRVAIALIASGLVTSSGSLLALAITIVALFVHFSPLRFPWLLNLRRTGRVAWIAGLVIVPLLLALAASSGSRTLLLEATVAKGSTGSFFNRTASDLYALQLLLQTHGLGVGLGSNRASSLLTSLASNVGLAGFVAFWIFVWRLFRRLPQEHAWLRWAGFALLLNMCIDVPDVTSPVLWIAILLAVRGNADTRAVPHHPALAQVAYG